MDNSIADQKPTVPTYGMAHNAVASGDASALERFVADWEPLGMQEERQWREQLAEVLREILAPNDAGQPRSP